MAADADMVNVFRSADEDAEEDARAIKELLTAQGIEAVLLDDSAPAVPSGAWEVRPAPADTARAEQLISDARLPDAELTEISGAASLDAETIFTAGSGSSGEMEAMAVKSMLEASGIAAFLVGDAVLPNLAFEVRVAKEQAGEARRLMEEARAIGGEAADEEEQSTEAPLNP
jgi:hypothetical protein